ncbi:hypothetical protein [Flavobacterium salmonis]|uniref:Outer membrane protein beta-barrel domain-containing protein n=1 Tax=Flavobacterium salmonis TaxID=2654844 RepID=A0A6V6Z883_9FLAO|nr:hypothetical protein [Flavobacterium salmonis]CAD0007980.1 hypothetical protein FLAT13_04150 [Flavobacterium salmonis]
MTRITKNILLFLLFFRTAYSQTTYPKINGYIGIMHPIVTFSEDETTTNFDGHYVVAFPVGINLWKTSKIGFSFEIVPTIKDEDGVSKSNNLTFHPGVLVPLGSGFSFAGRVAFETSGRYGFTPVFNKTLIKSENCSYYAALPLPVRFANDKPATLTVGFQLGVLF